MRIGGNYEEHQRGSSHLAPEEGCDENELHHTQDRVRGFTGRLFLIFIISNSLIFCVLEILLICNGITLSNSKWREEQYELADTIENYGDKTKSPSGFYLLESQESQLPIQGLERFPPSHKHE